MKLVYLAVSWIVANMVDCRSHPGPDPPDSQYRDISERVVGYDFTFGPDLITEEATLEETRSEETAPTTTEPVEPFTDGFAWDGRKFDLEEESRQSDSDSEGQQPDFTFGPDLIPEETTLEETRSEETAPTTTEPVEPFTDGFAWDGRKFDLEEESGSDEAFERSTCKAKLGCSLLGGFCVTNTTHCRGRLVPGGCKGSNCECCISGCPEDQGFFRPPGSSQCFMIYNGSQLLWAAGRAKCQSLGLALAKPYDAIALRSYIQERFGLTDNIWLDARGDGSKFVWQRDNKPISSYNPLWYSGHPGSEKNSSYCLTLMTEDYYWKSYPNQPYFRQPCSSWTELPLCELIME